MFGGWSHIFCDNSIEYELYSVYEGLMELHKIFFVFAMWQKQDEKKKDKIASTSA